MCMLIDKKVRNNHHKENGYCIGYKVLRSDGNVSPYRNKPYGIGWQRAVLKEEVLSGEVNYGLHLFLNKRDAIMEIEDFMEEWDNMLDDFKIIKVYYRPEDVIAYGTYNIRGVSTRNVAVKRLLVESMEDVQ